MLDPLEVIRIRRQTAEEIALTLLAEADDEAQRPTRDAVSRAIEEHYREAARIARSVGAVTPPEAAEAALERLDQ